MQISDRLIDLAIQVQQVPSPTFGERTRAEFIKTLFEQQSEVLSDISFDSTGNVYAKYSGKNTQSAILVSAHLDTVFPFETPLDIKREKNRIYGPGLGDNSLSVAALLCLVEQLKANQVTPASDIWLVANTCEEGLGDLAGMKAVVERFKNQVMAYIVLEGMGYDHIIHHAIGVLRYRVTIKTQGGHSWADFGSPSAIHEMSKLVAEISKLEPPSEPKTTFNIGKFSGGTTINTIASEASIDLDMRSASQAELEILVNRINAILNDFRKPGCIVEVKIIGERPSGYLALDHPLAQIVKTTLTESGVKPLFLGGSTDANIPLSKGYPSLVMGITRGGGAHTVNEYIETDNINLGFGNIYLAIRKLAG